eukprot:Tbor_TRINITY_DN248_c0_g1::TRINITY_DN248_c0_g1_i1::g.12230::m.12230
MYRVTFPNLLLRLSRVNGGSSFLSQLWRGTSDTRDNTNECILVPVAEFASAATPTNASSGKHTSLTQSEIFDAVEGCMHSRRSCKQFDSSRPVNPHLMKRILEATIRSPTAFNLQPWTAVVVQDDPLVRDSLAHAALGQPAVKQAPITIVFAGDMQPTRYAPHALEAAIESGYFKESYGPRYLRMVYYMLHGGPRNIMGSVKNIVSDWYSSNTGTAMLTVPTSMQAYAWKQTMIPVTNFVTLATAAGLSCNIMEGIDENLVKKAVGLPDGYTVPCIVSVGYPRTVPKQMDSDGCGTKQDTDDKVIAPGALHPAMSPRFSYANFIHNERF